MRILRKIKNFFFWGWKLRNDVNWDYSSVYYVLEVKLGKLRTGCYQDGHHVWSENSREYKAISECINLCKKLQESYHDNLNTVPGMDKLCFENGRFFNRMTNQENTWMKMASEKDDLIQKKRKERLFFLLNKWSDFWWD